MAKIAIYDSGVGGLSIYHEIAAALPSVECVFISDNQAYPYGVKSADDLLKRVVNVADATGDTYKPNVLVLACNTASTVCLPTLRERLEIPVVGVVPAIKPAAELTQTKVLGLLATPATVGRAYTDTLINDFAPNCEVIKVGSSRLVDMAEAKLRGQDVCLNELKSILSPFLDEQRLDIVVLACTHFPLLKEEIEQVFRASNKKIKLIDSGRAIAKRVATLLAAEMGGGLCGNSDQYSGIVTKEHLNIACFTQELKSSAFVTHLKSIGFGRIEQLSVPSLVH